VISDQCLENRGCFDFAQHDNQGSMNGHETVLSS